MAGVNLGSAYLTVMPSTRGLAPALSKAWGEAQSSARAAGEKAGSEYSSGASKAAKSTKIKNIFDGAVGTAKIEGIKTGQAFSTETHKPIKGLRGKIAEAFAGYRQIGTKAGNEVGTGFVSGTRSVLKRFNPASLLNIVGFGSAGLSAGALFATTFTKGLDRYMNLEQAEAKLKALGNTEADTQKIMDTAKGATKGTAFSADKAVNISANLVASGVDPAALEGPLKNIINYAAVGGVELDQMGAIWNKVAASGKLDGEAIAQLSDAGIPVLKNLSEELGIAQAAVVDLASEGGISYETYNRAMTNGLAPDAAVQMGDTLKGSAANAQAAIARLGAEIWKQIGPTAKTILEELTKKFDEIAPKIEKIFTFFKDHETTLSIIAASIGAMTAAWGLYVLVTTGIPALLGTVKGAMMALNATIRANPIGVVITILAALVAAFVVAYQKSETFRKIVDGALNGVKTAAKVVGDWFAGPFVNFFKMVGEGIKTVFSAIGAFFTTIWDGIKIGLTAVKDFFVATWENIKFVVAVALAIILTILSPFINAVIAIFNVLKDALIAAWNAITGFLKPIVEALVNFFKERFETAKNNIIFIFNAVKDFFTTIWNSISAALKPVIDAIVNFFKARFETAKSNIMWIFNSVKDFLVNIWNSITGFLLPVVDNIKNKVVGGFNAMKDQVKSAIQGLKDGITTIWNGIKAVFRDPINAVIRFINDPFIININSMLDKFGLSHRKISPLREVAFAQGGVLPGYTPGRDVHHFINPASGTALHLSGGEAIMRPEWTKAVGGPSAVASMNLAARKGMAFANGGVAPVPGRGNRHTTGYPWATWAGDYPIASGTPVKSWKSGIIALVRYLTTSYGRHVRINHDDGTSSLYAHLQSAAVSAGQRVTAGQTIGYSGSTGNSTGPHLHFETMGGPFNGGVAIFDWLGDLVGKLTKPLSNLKGSLGSSLIGQMMGAFADQVVGYGKSWIGGLFDNGGVLQPGLTMAMNKTGQPEAVLTNEQWRNMSTVAAAGAKGTTVNNPTFNVTVDADDLDEVSSVIELMNTLGLQAARG